MNDLDKRIAELKGWEFLSAAEYEKLTGRETYEAAVAIRRVAPGAISMACEHGAEGWSTSDAKALELVDELLNGPGTRTPTFRMDYHAGGIEKWGAQFRLGYFDEPQPLGSGNTRPEAICRAYIAAREFMERKP